MTITGKSKWASPDQAFVAVQGSGSLSLQGVLCTPVRWLCFIDSCKLSLAGWGKDHFLMFVRWLTKYDNMSDKWMCFPAPQGVGNSSGICGCWEDALRDRYDIGWCWKMVGVFQKLVKAFAMIFLAALDHLCVFLLLYKDKARCT